MTLTGIVNGNYGQTIQLTIKDIDTDTAADVSAYSTAQKVQLKDPSGNTADHAGAAFNSDGSDGLLDYTTASGDIDEAGTWAIRTHITSASAVLISQWLEFDVL
jgi:hypothetical protein